MLPVTMNEVDRQEHSQWRALPLDVYPQFIQYPTFVVDFQLKVLTYSTIHCSYHIICSDIIWYNMVRCVWYALFDLYRMVCCMIMM
jgi:hypothetical protein